MKCRLVQQHRFRISHGARETSEVRSLMRSLGRNRLSQTTTPAPGTENEDNLPTEHRLTPDSAMLHVSEVHAYGTLLRTLRYHAGLTQSELAVESGVSRSSIQNFESGRIPRPRRDSHEMLAQALTSYLDAEEQRQFHDIYRAVRRLSCLLLPQFVAGTLVGREREKVR